MKRSKAFCTMDNVFALHPAASGLILSISKNFSLDIAIFIGSTAQISGQRQYNANRTHPVLASGKRKKMKSSMIGGEK